MKPAHDMKLGHCFGVALSCNLPDLIHGHGVSIGIFRFLAECAQSATGDADVGWIDVPVDVEVRHVPVPAFPLQVSHVAESQNVMTAEHGHAVLKAQALTGFHLLENRAKPAVLNDWSGVRGQNRIHRRYLAVFQDVNGPKSEKKQADVPVHREESGIYT